MTIHFMGLLVDNYRATFTLHKAWRVLVKVILDIAVAE